MKEEILKAIKELLAEGRLEIRTDNIIHYVSLEVEELRPQVTILIDGEVVYQNKGWERFD